MKRFLLIALLLIMCGCGGSKSDSAPVIEQRKKHIITYWVVPLFIGDMTSRVTFKENGFTLYKEFDFEIWDLAQDDVHYTEDMYLFKYEFAAAQVISKEQNSSSNKRHGIVVSPDIFFTSK